jgi:hypothetical protein
MEDVYWYLILATVLSFVLKSITISIKKFPPRYGREADILSWGFLTAACIVAGVIIILASAHFVAKWVGFHTPFV